MPAFNQNGKQCPMSHTAESILNLNYRNFIKNFAHHSVPVQALISHCNVKIHSHTSNMYCQILISHCGFLYIQMIRFCYTWCCRKTPIQNGSTGFFCAHQAFEYIFFGVDCNFQKWPLALQNCHLAILFTKSALYQVVVPQAFKRLCCLATQSVDIYLQRKS